MGVGVRLKNKKVIIAVMILLQGLYFGLNIFLLQLVTP